MTEQVVDAEVVQEPGQEVVHAPAAPPPTLFRTDDPAVVLKRATETANALAPVLREKGMLSSIDGKDYVRVEGWMTLGSMLGVTAVGVWTRELDDGWEAKVDARTLDGRVIGSAEAMCLKSERNWSDSDEYAIRSMAQTRASSKALASVLRFVVTLAGFSGTPAEEMTGLRNRGNKHGFASDKQRNLFRRLLAEAGGSPETVEAISSYAASELAGGRDGEISKAIDALMKKGETAKKVGMDLGMAANAWQQKQTDAPADTEGMDEEPQGEDDPV